MQLLRCWAHMRTIVHCCCNVREVRVCASVGWRRRHPARRVRTRASGVPRPARATRHGAREAKACLTARAAQGWVRPTLAPGAMQVAAARCRMQWRPVIQPRSTSRTPRRSSAAAFGPAALPQRVRGRIMTSWARARPMAWPRAYPAATGKYRSSRAALVILGRTLLRRGRPSQCMLQRRRARRQRGRVRLRPRCRLYLKGCFRRRVAGRPQLDPRPRARGRCSRLL